MIIIGVLLIVCVQDDKGVCGLFWLNVIFGFIEEVILGW